MPTPSPLDAFFLFALGQEVTLLAMLTPFLVGSPSAHATRELLPQKFIVVERTITECPGGNQQHYHCRALSICDGWEGTSFTRDLFSLNECELTLYPGTEGNGTP